MTASEATPDLGFIARMMALCSLPRTNPGKPASVQARQRPLHALHERGRWWQAPLRQLPAPDPRMDLYRSHENPKPGSLFLGRSLSEFMRSLGINSDSGGARGEQTRLRNQMNRLFGCTVSLIYEDESGFARVTSPVADKHEFWWNERKPGERMLWDSKIHLGEAFFNEIIQHPVPLDMHTLTALKRSSLGLDLYLCWSTGPSRSALPSGSRGSKCTVSSEHTRPRPAITTPSKPSGTRFSGVGQDQAGLAWPELRDASGRPDPLALGPGHRSAQSRPARPLDSPFPASHRPAEASAGRLGPPFLASPLLEAP